LIYPSNEFSDNVNNKLIHTYDLGNFKGYSGKFQPHVLEKIRQIPQVEYIEKDQTVNVNELTTQKRAPWGLARISHRDLLTDESFNKYHYDDNGGHNVTVYVIDTGINIHHVEFEGRALWGATIPDGDADEDANGHGTHCAGTIASRRYGVAKKAHVVAVKVLKSNGSGTMSDVLKGVEWAAADHKRNKHKRLGSAANMSLGGGYSRALNTAVDNAVAAGIHFAVAAGNEDSDACETSPASAENCVTVGASTVDDERAFFSNHGKCVDIFAPGLQIISTWIGSTTATNVISGTSMASPHIAGLMAYLLTEVSNGNKDELTRFGPAEMKTLLFNIASKEKLSNLPKDTVNLLAYNKPKKASSPKKIVRAVYQEDTDDAVIIRGDKQMLLLKGLMELMEGVEDVLSSISDASEGQDEFSFVDQEAFFE